MAYMSCTQKVFTSFCILVNYYYFCVKRVEWYLADRITVIVYLICTCSCVCAPQ